MKLTLFPRLAALGLFILSSAFFPATSHDVNDLVTGGLYLIQNPLSGRYLVGNGLEYHCGEYDGFYTPKDTEYAPARSANRSCHREVLYWSLKEEEAGKYVLQNPLSGRYLRANDGEGECPALCVKQGTSFHGEWLYWSFTRL